jgi:arylsulfatase B/arylsulfatase I/J
VTVLHVIADDLGYQDLGHFNGGKTVSHQINARIEEGILLRQYYTYKVCGPSRAAIMTGRYPRAMGYYDMEGQEAVPLEYTMLPEVLQRNGWSTHALGKWNLGHLVKEYTPTFREVVGVVFLLCYLYLAWTCCKTAKGAYLEISSTSKHKCNMLNEMQYM